MFYKKIILSAILLASPFTIVAQKLVHPTGIFAVSDSIDAAIEDDIYTLDYVDGVVLRYNWAILQPGKSTFNFAPVLSEISKAKFYGKKVSLGIVFGAGIPHWIYDEGVTKLDFKEIPYQGESDKVISFSMCAPWDKTYLKYFKDFITQLNSSLQADTSIYNNIVQVKVGGVNRYSLELALPSEVNLTNGKDTSTNATEIWQSAGYRPYFVLDAFSQIVRHYRSVFKTKALNIPFIPDPYSLPLIGSAGQAIGKNKQTLMAQLIDKSVVIAGNKLMVQWNALNKNFVPVALDSAMQNGAYGGLQISFKYYGNPPGDKSDSLMYLFDYAFAKNINYMELHCGTLRNLPEAAKYGYDLFHTRDGLITEDILVPHLYNNAPNPFVDFTYIKLTAKAPRKPMMQLFDCNGIFIREVSPVKVDEYEYLYFISGENLPSGTYTVYVKVREKQLGMKILKINK